MPRNRMVKLSSFDDVKMGKLSALGFKLLIGMLCFSDDCGTCMADARYLKAQIFKYDTEVTIEDIEEQLILMCKLNIIYIVVQSGETYFVFRNFLKHQSISRPSNTKYLNDGEIIEKIVVKKPLNINKIGVSSEEYEKGIRGLIECSVSTQIIVGYTKDEDFLHVISSEQLGENVQAPDPKDDTNYKNYVIEKKKGNNCPVCLRKYSDREEDRYNNAPVIDHIYPRSKGGSHSINNLRVICFRCNNRKYNSYNYQTDDVGGLSEYSSHNERVRSANTNTNTNTNTNNKESNKESGPCFESWWKPYPRKEKKKEAEQAYLKYEEIIGHDILMRCVLEHPDLKKNDPEFTFHAHNFLERKPWKDLPPVRRVHSAPLPPVNDPISSDQARSMVKDKL